MIGVIPYTGSKIKLVEQIVPHLIRPEFNNFYDMMCGTGAIAANVPYNSIVMNDINAPLINLLNTIVMWGSDFSVDVVQSIMADQAWKQQYIKDSGEFPKLKGKDVTLNSKNKQAYLLLRKMYNTTFNDPYVLLTLVYHSYNNLMRFNQDGGFNAPFGERTFTDSMKSSLVSFIDTMRPKTIVFTSGSIGVWDFNKEPKDSVFYFDPPYITGHAQYRWQIDQDRALRAMLDQMDADGHKWALSNAFKNNGKSNDELIEWAKQYDVVDLSYTYEGSYEKRKNKGATKEVLIKNYD